MLLSRTIRQSLLRLALCLLFASGAATAASALSISGQIRYYSNGIPVGGVTVRLQGPVTVAPVQTDAAGQFAFSGLATGNWRITPERLGAFGPGISSLDGSFVLQAVVGSRTLTTDQLVASDVTGNGTVSALDASRILQFDLGIRSEFQIGQQCGSDWAFDPLPASVANQQIIPPQSVSGTCQRGAIAYQPLTADAQNQDFLAVLYGDATGNWPGTLTPTGTSTTSPTITLTPTRTATPASTATRTPTLSPTFTASRSATLTATRTPTLTATTTPTAPPTSTPTQVFAWPTIVVTSAIAGFTRPVHITHAGDGSGRIFVVDQVGRIRIIKKGALQTGSFLDIATKVNCCNEEGLLSVAFPPGYASKGYFYVYYTNLAGDNVVARYRLSANPDVADATSEQILLTIPHPTNANHNGGQLAFGPTDGHLYIGTGDGGGSGDVPNNAQNTTVLLGKILRIDVEAPTPTGTPTPYLIPTSNPTVPTPGARREIWAFGFRNPWRFSFDRQTHDLYIGDVGQDSWEEIDVQPATSPGGENYGWRIMEGLHCFNPMACTSTGLTLPVVEYSHSLGCSVTGGFVYRGSTYPRMSGVYFYGDFCSGRIWGLKRDAGNWYNTQLLDTTLGISTFGEDEAGNLYVGDLNTRSVWEITDPSLIATPTPTP